MGRFRRINDTAIRAEELLVSALALAAEVGYQQVTRDAIAARCGVSVGTISHYFGTMTQMRRSLMRQAVARGVLPVVAQGLAACDPHAQAADPAIKTKALEYLANR